MALGSVNVPGVGLNAIHQSTGVTGTSTTAAAFSNSGIALAAPDDTCINPTTGNVYKCTTGGAPSAAKWVYTGCIKGPQGATGATGGTGATGAAGANATINGVNALTLQAGDGLTLSQSGSTATISLNSEAKAAVEALKKSLGGTLPSTTLANNTPAVIQKVAAAGLGANFWSVGDKVGIALSGTVGALAISGTYYAFIIGFNHNSGIEGLGIHFQFGKDSSGKDIAFCDSKYETNGSDAAFRMNTTDTNTGGWASSYMRNTICPAFLAAFPAAWKNVIAPCTKYTDNVGGGNGNVAANITATVDKIFNLSEQEVFGTITSGNTCEANYQKQYEYYANGNIKVKYKHDSTNSICNWWLRSVNTTGTKFFRIVYKGNPDYTGVTLSIGFAPAFKVA